MMKKAPWDETYADGDDFAQLNTAEVSFLVSSLGDVKNIKHLDVGCGTGALNRDLYMKGAESTGIDTSERAIEIAENSVSSSRVGITFLNVALQEIQADDFDLITAKYTYRFIDDRRKFLQNITQKLTSNGWFVIIDALYTSLPEHKRGIVLPQDIVESELKEFFFIEVKKYRKNIYYFARLK